MLPTKKQKQFNNDLLEVFISANIPLNKLDNPIYKIILTPLYKLSGSCRTSLSKNYLEPLFEREIVNIQNTMSNHSIWISVDETTDSEGRHPTTLIVGVLNNQDFIPPFILNVDFLDKVNSETISKFIINSLLIIWPQRIQYERLNYLFLILLQT